MQKNNRTLKKNLIFYVYDQYKMLTKILSKVYTRISISKYHHSFLSYYGNLEI